MMLVLDAENKMKLILHLQSVDEALKTSLVKAKRVHPLDPPMVIIIIILSSG